MISKSRDDNARTTCMSIRNAQSQIIRFRARARIHRLAQSCGKCAQEPFGIFENERVQISRMRIECRCLTSDCRSYMRMTMPDGWHIVVSIQKSVSLGVEKPNAFTPFDLQRPRIKLTIRWAKQSRAPRDHFCFFRRKQHASGDECISHCLFHGFLKR